jgi:hypothetical protein
MMRSLLFAVALFAGTAASAATYDAFTSFDGVGSSTDGAFTFGEFDGTTFTPFDTVGFSTFPGTLSYSSSGHYYPVAVKTATGGSYVSNTVTIPSDALILHPGPGPSGGPYAAIRFVAPTAGTYTITANAVQIDRESNTVEAGFLFRGLQSSFDLTPGGSTFLTDKVPTALNTTRTFASGEALTLLIGNAGNYYFDTTAVNFTVTDSVPEPAAWSLLIAGFVLTGAALRRSTGHRFVPHTA